MDKNELAAIGYLPPHLAAAVRATAALRGGATDEIRLRVGRPISLVIRGKNAECGERCTESDIADTVGALCRHSLYSYSEEIKEGVITTECGIRAGVAGRATVRDGRIAAVSEITSVNIRIPHRVAGAADELYALVKASGSVLVYSPPCGGKTTALRELVPLLSGGRDGRRVSVIDTRHELICDRDVCMNADFFSGYPRNLGIDASLRTMSPEYIICDEISSDEDVRAVLRARSAGVNIICSAHAGSEDELRLDGGVRRLIDCGVFGCFYRPHYNS